MQGIKECRDGYRQQAFGRLHLVPNEIEESADRGIAIRDVLEDGSSYASEATKTRFSSHLCVVVHHSPTQLGWISRMKYIYSILLRKLRRTACTPHAGTWFG